MNLMQVFQKRHSKAVCNKIVAYIGHKPDRFKVLVSLLLDKDKDIAMRASWPFGFCVERHPGLMVPHIRAIIRNLKRPGLHDAVKRGTFRALQYVDIPNAVRGEVIDACFSFLMDTRETIAVRVFSMSTLAGLVKDIPELSAELRIIIEDQLPFASPAFRSRARKVMKALGHPPSSRPGKP